MTGNEIVPVTHTTTGKVFFTRMEDVVVTVTFETNSLYSHLAEITVSHADFQYNFTTELKQLEQGRYSGAAGRNTTVTPAQGGQVHIQAHTNRLRVAVAVPVNEVSLFVNRAQAIATSVINQVACPSCHERAVLFDDGTIVCVVEGTSHSPVRK